MSRLLLVAFFAVAVMGCTGEDPNPHLKDPIYKDLKSKTEGHEKAILEAKKKLVDLQKKLEGTEPNSIDKKDVEREIANTKKAIFENEQRAKYFTIRANRREVVDRISAREAKNTGKEWPNSREYSDYQLNNRLNQLSRNWGERVPRLNDRLKKSVTKEEAAVAPEAGGGGH